MNSYVQKLVMLLLYTFKLISFALLQTHYHTLHLLKNNLRQIS